MKREAITPRDAGMEMVAPVGLMASILDPFRDAWLVARARLQLLTTGGSGMADVIVEAFHERLVLGGEVATNPLRGAAEDALRLMSGVVGVSNRIRVRGAHARRFGDTDTEICTALATRLQKARAGCPSRIYVDGVYDGVVTLAGTAATESERLAAFEIAIHAPGVRRVVSDVALESPATAGNRRDADAA